MVYKSLHKERRYKNIFSQDPKENYYIDQKSIGIQIYTPGYCFYTNLIFRITIAYARIQREFLGSNSDGFKNYVYLKSIDIHSLCLDSDIFEVELQRS